MQDQAGRAALVTGAGFGMGAGVAKALAARGAEVFVNDLRAERAEAVAAEIRASGGRATALPFDVTDRQAVADAVAGCGELDILVNNAGNAGGAQFMPRPFVEMDPADWAPFIAVNLMGVLHCTHAVLAGMCARRWGRVITISSDAGRIGSGMGISVYGAAKAGAAHLMRHIAAEVGDKGVTANVIALGHMDTIQEPFASHIVQEIPCGRLGSPRDVAAAVTFLASAEAEWVNGSTLVVNGGYPAI